MSHVVVLIHGTWARKAPWTQEGSPLRNALESLGDDIRIESFDWSGGNSFGARRKAVIDLQSRIEKLLESDPNAHLSFVAHSHGGNVAMATVENDHIRARVVSIVCLSTPFIIVGEHASGLPDRARIFIGMLLKVVPWLISLWLLMAAALVVAMEGVRSAAGALVMSLIIVGGVYGATRYVKKWHLTFWERYSHRVADFIAENRIRNPDDLRLLVLRPVADEASSAMNMTQIISWLSTQAWDLVAWIPRACISGLSVSSTWSKKHSGVLWAIAVVPYILAIVLILTTPLVGSTEDRKVVAFALCATSVFFIPMLRVIVGKASVYILVPLAVAASIVLLVLFVPIALAITLAAAPFGLARIYLFPSLRMSAEAAPAGHSHIVQLPAMKIRGLMHSTTYQDSVAIDATLKWVSGR